MKWRNTGWALLGVPFLFWFLEPAKYLDAPGWNLILHLLHLLFAFATGLLLFLSGRLALGCVGLLPEDKWERVLVATCVGYMAVSLVLFALAAAGAIHPQINWVLIVLACAAAAWRGRGSRFRGDEHASGKDGGAPWPPERLAAWVLGGLLGLLFLGSFIEALFPTPQSDDPLSQNLAYARFFADAGGFRFTPENTLYYALTAYWELFLMAIAVFIRSEISMYVIAQLLHVFLGLGGTILGIVCLVRRLARGDTTVRWAVALFGAVLFAGMRPDITHVRRFPLLVFTAKSDLIVVALQVAAALVIFEVIARREGERRGLAILAGGFLGMAAGTKLTGGIAAIGLGAGFWLMPSIRMTVKERALVTGWCAAGLCAGVAPGLLKNLAAMGNPVYPLLASYFGRFENPDYFRLLHGFNESNVLKTWWKLRTLLFPSVPFFLLLAAFGGKWEQRVASAGNWGFGGVRYLLLSAAISVLVIGKVFSADFPLRYALFISAFTAVCAACMAGGMIDRIKRREGTGRLYASPWVLPAAWGLVFIIALLPVHLDNRLKRALKTATRTPVLADRFFRMSPISRFQGRWYGRIPPDARPLTFHRPEVFLALTRGWFPVVAIKSPDVARLFTQNLSGAGLEKALVRRGITHVYFETKMPVPSDYPLQPLGFVAYLRGRSPVMRADGFEMYALAGSKDRK